MSYTKRQFLLAALEEIGIASYDFDIEPQVLQSALRRLDAMIASWIQKGIRIGYPLPSSPQNSTLDEETNVPDSANEAIITNLAIRISPSFGKIVSRETKMVARDSYTNLLPLYSEPLEMILTDRTPLGQGNKTWVNSQDPFVQQPDLGIQVGRDSFIQGDE